MSEPPAKYKGSKWAKAEFCNMRTDENRPDDMACFSGICWSGEEFRSNLIMLTKEIIDVFKPRYFIIDKKDYDWVNTQMNGNRKTDEEEYKPVYLMSLGQFLEHQNKKIYIRTLPSSYASTGPYNRVFTDDILEIIPILLKQQDTSLKASNNRLENYRNEWKLADKNAYNTIDIQEFQKILEEFDINKNLITITDDISHTVKLRELSSRNEHLVKTISPDGKEVIYAAQAVFHVFESTFCGLDWFKDDCIEHSNCMEEYKQKIIEVMNKYANMNKQTLITVEDVESNIQTLRSHPAYTFQKKTPKPDFQFQDYRNDQMIPMLYSRFVCSQYHLPPFRNVPLDFPKDTENIPGWKARMYCIVGWIQYFKRLETDHLLDFLMELLEFKAPLNCRMNADFLVRHIILTNYHEPLDSQEMFGPTSQFFTDFTESIKDSTSATVPNQAYGKKKSRQTSTSD